MAEPRGLQVTEEILREFKGFDCTACRKHFLMESRVTLWSEGGQVTENKMEKLLMTTLVDPSPSTRLTNGDGIFLANTVPSCIQVNKVDQVGVQDKNQEVEQKQKEDKSADASGEMAKVDDLWSQRSSKMFVPSQVRIIKKPQESVTKPVQLNQVQAPSFNPLIVDVKKPWTTDDLKFSTSLVNAVPCLVSFLWDVTRYHVQATADADKLSNLHESIQEYSTAAQAIGRTPAVNEIVFAPYEGEFYRAKVTRVHQPSDTIDVVFVDCGDGKTVHLKDCREPSDELMENHPVYGVEFLLALDKNWPEGVSKVPGSEFTVAAEMEVTMTIEKKLDDHFTGKLHISDGRTFNDMVNNLIKKANAPAKAPFKVVIGSEIARAGAKWTMKNVKLTDKFQTEAIVQIQCVNDLSKLNLTAKVDEEKLESLQQLIDSFFITAPAMTRIPEVDEIVIAPYGGVPYRGQVTEVKDSVASIVFLDYGDRVSVQVKDLKEPSEEIMKHPIYGIVMQMADLPSGFTALADNPKIVAAIDQLSQVEITKSSKGPFGWVGNLWFSEDRSWVDLANEVIHGQ